MMMANWPPSRDMRESSMLQPASAMRLVKRCTRPTWSSPVAVMTSRSRFEGVFMSIGSVTIGADIVAGHGHNAPMNPLNLADPAVEPDTPLPVLYRDDHLIAVHKPAGLLVHRTGIDRHETRFAVQMLRQQCGRFVYPVQRLDKGTSGVLLFAFDSATARTLASHFEGSAVEKRYLAVVRGHPAKSGIIDHALTRIRDSYAEGRADAAAQSAVTRYRRMATWELPESVERYATSRYALVELAPVTGRRHQLRRHMKHIAHPIIGDATYGKGVHNRLFQTRFGSTRLLLACTALACAHPLTGAPLRIEAPLAPEFARLLEALEAATLPPG
jgi:tRNA pseudouridine65 synthase